MAEFENPDHWDTAAQHYEKTAHPFTARYAEDALSRVALTSDSRVLDVAAGTGALAALIRDDVVLGEDQSLAAAGV